jgi:hypothetical protein
MSALIPKRPHPSRLLPVGILFLTTAACGAGADAPGSASGEGTTGGSESWDSHAAFLGNLAAHCGNAFEGRLELTPDGDAMLTGTETLLVHFRDCVEGEVRLPFHIEVEETGAWNRSRTWYVMRVAEGLELRHDHREPDGSESRRTWYGGVTLGTGTATRQDFHSPERTAAAGVPVGWRIEIEPGAWYRYGTTFDGEFDWMIAFDLRRPIAGDIPDAWGHDRAPSRIPGPP